MRLIGKLIETALMILVFGVKVAIKGGRALVENAAGIREFGRRLPHTLSRKVYCPEGCEPEPADDYWGCECDYRGRSYIWDPCPGCGRPCQQIQCSRCGHSIQNPVWGVRRSA